MNFIYFSLKIEDGALHSQDANFSVSSPFKKSEINDLLVRKVKQLEFIPDLNSVKYLIKENQLYIEGLGYKRPEPINTDLIY